MIENIQIIFAVVGGGCIGAAITLAAVERKVMRPYRAFGQGHVFGGYKDGDERYIRDPERMSEPAVCQVYYGMKWWTAWTGGPCPLLDCVRVDVRFRDGREVKNRDPGGWNWDHVPSPHRNNPGGDIIAYRLSDAPA